MADTLALVTRLADLLDAENDALLKMDLATASGFLPAKQDAADALGRAGIAADATALRPAVAALRVLADENRRLLERAITVQGRVLELLARAARAADPAPRYGRSGGYAARRETGFAISASA